MAPDAVVVNVQGDEPLIDPEQINCVARLLQDMPDAAIATCATPIQQADALFNPSAVKVVCTLDGRALYFSRAPIPWARDARPTARAPLPPALPALPITGCLPYGRESW